VAILVGSPLVDAELNADGMVLVTPHERFIARTVVNAAGLYADEVSTRLGARRFTTYPCHGEYAELKPSRRSWVRGLVYPLPHPSGAGLGVHLARTTWGSLTLGPTIHDQSSRDDYEDGRLPPEDFVEPARRMLRDLRL
jgi:L-2-hydroxyglutarate oxidase